MSEPVPSPEIKLRTHPKVLVKPLVALVLIGLAYWGFSKLMDILGATGDVAFWFNLTGMVILGFFLILYSVKPLLLWLTDTFEVTGTQVKTDAGIISRRSQEIHISRISQVEVERGLLDRIFGSGTIKLYDASNTLGLEFKDVPRVMKVREEINKLRGV